MATVTQRQNLPIPEVQDDPNIVDDVTRLAQAIEKRLFAVHANTANRDAATPAPGDGMFCYLQDMNQVQVFQDGAWANYPPRPVWIAVGSNVPAANVGVNGDIFYLV